MTISSSGSETNGETYTLTCSATLIDPTPLPANVPAPNFHWYFGPTGDAPLPPDVTLWPTLSVSSYTYISNLVFSPLVQSHAGTYTCRLGAGNLVENVTIMNGTTVFRFHQTICSCRSLHQQHRILSLMIINLELLLILYSANT